ncbi:hypothetical protein BC833DRAFT_598486 [Globomyces pollinis-pini]|nr:hypothetical protein BC833DRAFT_598486 [Globomyces pollinis-pini]
MILNYLILLSVAHADKILESQWLDSYSCDGPPNAMYIFNINDIEAYEPDEDETWAPLYTDFACEYIIGTCGIKKTPIYNGCCFASLDLTISEGWKSGSPTLLPSDDTYDGLVYLGANGNTYCSVKPMNGSLFMGLVQVLVLADDTTCVDQHYKCKKNGEFLVYNENGCNGNPISVSFQPQSTELSHPSLGTFEGQMVTFQKGTTQKIWTLFTPSDRNIVFVPNPNPFVASDVLRIGLLSLQLLLYGWGAVQAIIRLQKGYKLYLVAQLCSQLLYMAFVSSYIYQDTVISNATTLSHVDYLGNWLYGLATLFNCYLTVLLLYSVKISFVPKWTLYPVCILLFLLHLLLNGSVYLNVCSIASLKKWSYCTSGLRKVWRTFVPYWIITMFLWNLIPTTLLIIYIVWQGVEKRNGSTTAKMIWLYDKPVFAILLVQIIIIASYQNVFQIVERNDYLNNDKAGIGVQALKGILRSLHSLFNILYLDRVPIIFKTASLNISKMTRSEVPNSTTGTTNTKNH